MRPKMHMPSIAILVIVSAVFSASPIQLSMDNEGFFGIELSVAHAKRGRGRGGDDDSDSGSSNSGSGSSNSGSGSGNSGSGSGNSGSGSSNSGSGGGNSGSGSSNSGSGSGNSGSGSGNSGPGKSSDQIPGPKSAIQRIELSASGVAIYYVDGSREEIRNRKYQFFDADGRTLISRHATGADLAHLRARANGISIKNVRHPSNPGKTSVTDASSNGNQVVVRYSNGWTEEISGGVYYLSDQYGRAAVKRPATPADIKRLRALAGN